MTYFRKATVRRYGRGRLALSDDCVDPQSGVYVCDTPGQTSLCIDQANAATAPFDAKVDDLAQNWRPTGFYTSADIRAIVSSVMTTIAQAQASIDQAAKEPSASQESLLRATDDLANAGRRSIDYLQAANQADAQGTRAINAVGLKRWVTDSLAAASSAMVTVSVVGCIRPWWVNALATFQSVFDKAWAVVKAVAGTLLAIGEDALKVASSLDDIYGVLKWGALAYGAYWVWTHVLEPGIRR